MSKKVARKPKEKKPKPVPVDGLGPKDKIRLRFAIRQVWSWNYARKLCIQRATNDKGFAVCEICKETVPKVYADHKTPAGEFDEGFISRMFVPSTELQALCSKCHGKKTREEAKVRREKAK